MNELNGKKTVSAVRTNDSKQPGCPLGYMNANSSVGDINIKKVS